MWYNHQKMAYEKIEISKWRLNKFLELKINIFEGILFLKMFRFYFLGLSFMFFFNILKRKNLYFKILIDFFSFFNYMLNKIEIM
jgi:hypothetical protein